MATIANVKKRVGHLTGRIGLGQALYEPFTSRIDEAYNEVIDELKEESLVVWNSTSGTVPNRVAPHLIALMAFNCCDDFGVSADRYARIVTRRNVALPEIRKFVRESTNNLDEPHDY